MVRFDLRLNPQRVNALRDLARRMSFESGQDVQWTDLVRLGMDWVLDYGSKKAAPAVGVANDTTRGMVG